MNASAAFLATEETRACRLPHKWTGAARPLLHLTRLFIDTSLFRCHFDAKTMTMRKILIQKQKIANNRRSEWKLENRTKHAGRADHVIEFYCELLRAANEVSYGMTRALFLAGNIVKRLFLEWDHVIRSRAQLCHFSSCVLWRKQQNSLPFIRLMQKFLCCHH